MTQRIVTAMFAADVSTNGTKHRGSQKVHEWKKLQDLKILIIKPTRCTNFSNLFLEYNCTCFGQFLCPPSGVFHCTQQRYMSYSFSDSLRAGSGLNCKSILIPLPSCQQTSMTYTIAVCTVKNS